MAAWDENGARVPYTFFECAAFGFAVKATCRGCKHSNSFSPAGLWWLFQRKHWEDEMRGRAGSRFRCVRCGSSGARLDAVREPPTLSKLPDPPEAEWKRACSRYRS